MDARVRPCPGELMMLTHIGGWPSLSDTACLDWARLPDIDCLHRVGELMKDRTCICRSGREMRSSPLLLPLASMVAVWCGGHVGVSCVLAVLPRAILVTLS